MNVFHLHVPKTGGTFLRFKVIEPLRTHCGLNLINKTAHHAWGLVEEDTYVISSFREPVKRIVSHYCHFIEANENVIPTIESFRQWYEINKTYLSNFQTKNFLVTDGYKNPMRALRSDPTFINVEINEDKLFQNLKRINVFIRDNQFNDVCLEQIKNKIAKECKIQNTFYVKDRYSIYNSRKESSNLFAQLSQSDIDSIMEDNELDYKVYLDNSLYWNNGQ